MSSLVSPVSNGSPKPVVQRHSSWEHSLLGDVNPDELGQAAVTPEARKHVLANLWERVSFFRDNPRANPSGRFSDIRWIQLKARQLWVSNGELLESMKGAAVRAISSEMVKGGVSVDVGQKPPTQMGDFPTSTGSTAAA